jgi:hypothetical protein
MPKRQPAPAKKPLAGVVLAGPNPGTVNGHFFGCVSALLMHDANSRQAVTKYGGCMWLESSPRIAAARCDIVRDFLEITSQYKRPPEWLLFIDSDMTFDMDVVDRMLETVENNPDKDIKILGGLCFAGGRGNKAFPTLYKVENAEGWTPDQPMDIVRVEEYPPDALVKVNATGGAFLMIHRQVLIDMQERSKVYQGYPNNYPWFREYEQAGQPFGEDVFFGLAAGAAGYSTWVHTGIKIGHMKSYELNHEVYQANREMFLRNAQGDG